MPRDHQPGGPSPPSTMDTARQGLNMFMFATFCWACLPMLWTRRRVGTRFFDYHAVIGLTGAWLFPSLFPGENPVPMTLFAATSTALLLWHGIATRRLLAKGVALHTQSGGDCVVGRAWESALVAAVGLGCLYLREGVLGLFLIGSFLCLEVFQRAVKQRENAERRAIRDALIEASYREGLMQDERQKYGL